MTWRATKRKHYTRYLNRYCFILFSAIILVWILNGCVSSENFQESPNAVQYYSSGSPLFSIGAVGKYDENKQPEVKIYLNVPYNNLIFKKGSGANDFTANLEIKLDLYRIAEDKKKEQGKSFLKTVHAPNFEQTQSFENFQFDHLFDVQPGKYELHATISDKNTDKSTQKRLIINVPEVQENSFIVSDIQLMSNKENNKNLTPEVSYNISSEVDSLKTDIQLVVPNTQNNLSVRMDLLKLKTDTLPAKLPYGVTPSRASLPYKGIDYEESDTLQSTSRRLSGISGLLTIDFPLPELGYGNYMIDIKAYDQADNQLFSKVREFAIKSDSYPKITDLREMVRALKYIMSPEEYEEIMSIDNYEELRLAFDKFWLELYESEPIARRMINTYYSRVEEANKLFPSFKEGWKTDPGMVYIVMGEPHYTEEQGDELIWYYTTNSPQSGGSIFFTFEDVTAISPAPYKHYVLQRRMGYEWIYRLTVERWRDGNVK